MSILIIEDDEPLIEILRYWLGNRPIRVARTMQEATEQIAKSVPQYIILDLGLPDSTPSKTIAEIKRIKAAARNAVIIVVTGFDGNEAPAREAGADYFVPKVLEGRVIADDIVSKIQDPPKKDSTEPGP